jgi:hypothetical protein
MPTDVTLEKRTMLAAFKQKRKPSLFLSSWFKTTERDIFRSKTAVIDVVRNEEAIAIDVVRSTGGRQNNNKRFTTKRYEPPMYNEFMSYTEDELLERMPGATEYDSPGYTDQLIAIVTDDQVENQSTILRSIELQASNVFFTGTVPLINNESLDYKQKTSHQITPGTLWDNTAAIPTVDIQDAAELNRKDGKVDSSVCIFGKQAWQDFLNRNIDDEIKWDNRNATLADINKPVQNTTGASYHGTFVAGSYNFQAWTYPQYYYVPVGWGLPNEGTLVPYVPEDLVAVLPESALIDLRLLYAGIPQLTSRVDPRFGITRMPVGTRADFQPYAYVDDRTLCLEVGVRSAPLCVPTQIDGWSVIKTRG